MPMSELAARSNSSSSRLSHVVAKLEQRGWVRRQQSPVDARVNVAVLTDAGSAKLAASAPPHVERVRSLVTTPDGGPGCASWSRSAISLLGRLDPKGRVRPAAGPSQVRDVRGGSSSSPNNVRLDVDDGFAGSDTEPRDRPAASIGVLVMQRPVGQYPRFSTVEASAMSSSLSSVDCGFWPSRTSTGRPLLVLHVPRPADAAVPLAEGVPRGLASSLAMLGAEAIIDSVRVVAGDDLVEIRPRTLRHLILTFDDSIQGQYPRHPG